MTYKLFNGLQQGTVNSPLLFSIYTAAILNMFNLNTVNNPQAIAFADDLIVYLADSWPSIIQEKLQETFNKLGFYFQTWKLTVNLDKCETILFRTSLLNANRNVKRNYKHFHIKGSQVNSTEEQIIPHKKTVKYLGIYLDERLHFKEHVTIQLKKASQVFMSLKRLFYSRYLNSDVKLICYQLLIRPIITYGCSIWYYISASLMEVIRIFERKCLRSCLSLFRTAESDYTKHFTNQILYNEAKIPRIDNFMIDLIRDNFLKASKLWQNSLIFAAFYPNDLYYQNTLNTRYISPEAFLFLDHNGYIQDNNDIPIIYHYSRHNNIKKITYMPHSDGKDSSISWKYDMPIPDVSKLKKKNNKCNYWWN